MGTKTLGFYINMGAEVQKFKTGGLVVWVSPLRRGSSEGLSTAALTHPQSLKQTYTTATRGINRPRHGSSDPVHLVVADVVSRSSSHERSSTAIVLGERCFLRDAFEHQHRERVRVGTPSRRCEGTVVFDELGRW